MQINLMLNGVRISEDVAPDMLLIDFVRKHACARSFWMTSRCCPAQCWPPAPTVTR